MKFNVEHTHKGSVDLNVNIVVSERPKEKEPDDKSENNTIFHLVGTIYFGIFTSLFAVFLENQVSSIVVQEVFHAFIILGGAVLFLVLGFGYTFYGQKFNNSVFRTLIKIVYMILGLMMLIVVVLLFIGKKTVY
jgi:hypothetical protein